MKTLISAIAPLTILPFYSSGINSLKELATQEFVKQIFDYPSLTAEGKLKFNNQPQPGEALSFKGQNLDFLNISGIKLWGAKFDGVTLNATNFFKADLTGCSFKGATLKNVNFQEANLTKADFERAHFANTKFQGAKLSETLTLPYYCEGVEILECYSDLKNQEDKKALNNLIGTGVFDFKNQTIKGLNLRGINLKGCYFSRNKIINCDLTNAQFGDGLAYASFSDVKLSDDFTLKDIRDLTSLYYDSTLPQEHKNILAKILLAGVNLSGTTLFEDFVIPPYQNYLDLLKRYSDFPEERENLNKLFSIIRLYLSYANLRNLDLQGINLTNADLKGAHLQGSTLFEGFKVPDYKFNYYIDLVSLYSNSIDPTERENLNRFFDIFPFKLEYCNLRRFNLQGINLTKVNLKGAYLQGSILFEGFKVPEYHNDYHYDRKNYDNHLVVIYGRSKDKKYRENLNKLFKFFPFKLSGPKLKGLNLEGMNFNNITFEGINFSGAILFEGFTVPEYKDSIDLIRLYSNSKDPKFRRNLNRLFDIYPLKLTRREVFYGEDQEYDSEEYRTIIVDLKNLDLAGINLMNSECRDVDFLGCNLTDSIYDQGDSHSLSSAKLDGIKWCEDFIFSSGLSEKELEEIYPKIAKTDRQKYFFKEASKLMYYGSLYERLKALDTK